MGRLYEVEVCRRYIQCCFPGLRVSGDVGAADHGERGVGDEGGLVQTLPHLPARIQHPQARHLLRLLRHSFPTGQCQTICISLVLDLNILPPKNVLIPIVSLQAVTVLTQVPDSESWRISLIEDS